mmetsp:Transcript_90177/g.263692  ORF Transcript_90177/g.263692 Transcript_90177/m.263692 type:complete len:493 (-) Transcript_90177:200-1678(-)
MSSVCLFEVKGSHAHRVAQLVLHDETEPKSEAQRKLHDIAKCQNFCLKNPERPQWARGAFVFVTPLHASEIRTAVEEYEALNQCQLKKHHLIASDVYVELVVEALSAVAWPTGGLNIRDAYQSSRPGALKHKADIALPTFSHVEATQASSLGPPTIDVNGMQLTVKHTFLTSTSETSDHSRLTHSTGDRPRANASYLYSFLNVDKLPPHDADYGPVRKRFQLKACAGTSLWVAQQAPTETSEESCVTCLSFSSEDFYDAYDGSFDHLIEAYEHEIIALQQAFHPHGQVPVRTHFMNCAEWLVRFAKAVFEDSPPPAADVAALWCLEDPLARKVGVKSVWTHLSKQVHHCIPVLMRLLELSKHFRCHEASAWKLQQSLSTSLSKRLKKEDLMMSSDAALDLSSLQERILLVLRDVLVQLLNNQSALICRAHRKHWTNGGRLFTLKETDEPEEPVVYSENYFEPVRNWERMERVEAARRNGLVGNKVKARFNRF